MKKRIKSKTNSKTKIRANPMDVFNQENEGKPNTLQKTLAEHYCELDAKAKDTFLHPASERAHKLLHESNKLSLTRFLRQEGISKIEVTFDGYGDSGQIESVAIFAKDKDVTGFAENKSVPDYVQHTGTSYSSGSHRKHSWKFNSNCREAVEDFCYDILQTKHGGWEINGGSFGSFTFDMTDEGLKIRLDMNERIEDCVSSEETY